jgi:mono/diheme cytochrome c family protein
MKKILQSVLIAIVLLIVAVVGFVSVSWNKNYDAPTPDIKASTDPEVIARGEYLAFGPAHCAHCHVPLEKIMEVEKGAKIPLSGGWELKIPLGTFRAPNITPDEETGIGNISDGEIARALRYSVSHNNKFLMPFMPFQEMSDEDITAIVSFLRSQTAVRHDVKKNKYSFLGKSLLAFKAVQPTGPIKPVPKKVKRDTSEKYGEYLAYSVANCYGCHTERNVKTGEFIGAPYAGGMLFEPDNLSQGYGFVSPNLTPDKETGVMALWSEQVFINRFKAGRVHKGTPMPWGAMANLEENDLKAIYRFLHTLEPVKHPVNKVVYNPGEEMP